MAMIQNMKSIGAKMLVAAVVAAGTLALSAGAAEARGSVVIGAQFGGGYHSYYRPHYWHGGPSFSVGFGVGPYWGGYYAPYYYPYPYYRSSVVYRDYDAYRDYDNRGGLLSSPYVQQALAADVGESITWANAGVIGRVTTSRDGWSGDRYCRELVQDLTIDGATRSTTATACQAQGGAWQMVANQP